MSKANPKRDGIGLMIYLVLFGAFFIASIISYFNSTQLLDIGLSAHITNGFIAIMSMAGLIRTIWHIHHF